MSFYITLPSDASLNYFKNNTVSKFRTYLPEPIKLQGPYEVGLAEISYPRTWNNVKEECVVRIWKTRHVNDTIQKEETKKTKKQSKNPENTLKRDEVDDMDITIIIPPGYYGSAEELLRIMSFDDYGQDLNSRIEFYYNKPNRRVVVEIKDGNQLYIPHEIAIILGFTREPGRDVTVVTSMTAPFSCDMDAGLHSLFIYSDIIQSRSVGDSDVPLLRIISVQGKDGDTIEKEFSRPHYMPISSNNFQTIEMNIMSEMGSPIQFERGKVHITLHFHPRRTWISL